jgi:two-component system cell cycle response regulator
MQILVVDDSAIYRQLLTNHLQDWNFPFTVAKDGSEAWDILQRPDCPKLVLLDWVMPGIDGIDLCRRIRAATEKPYSYVILLTGKDDKKDLVEAMEAGADDYLVKPFDERELKARLLVGKRMIGLHEELVSARDSMRYAATHDALTGLLNQNGPGAPGGRSASSWQMSTTSRE